MNLVVFSRVYSLLRVVANKNKHGLGKIRLGNNQFDLMFYMYICIRVKYKIYILEKNNIESREIIGTTNQIKSFD